MVYSPAKVVACVKCDGKVLREDGQTVTLPFGSEYSLLIKNLNPVRIQFKVNIDGTNATEGTWLVVGPNESCELERFIKGGNLEAGNRFKFIERTDSIEEHRGIKADDGLIRIEYQIEKRVVVDEVVHHTRHIYEDDYVPPRPWRRPWTLGGSDILRSSSASRTKGRSSPISGSSVRAMGMKSAESLGHADIKDSDSIGYYSYEFPRDAGLDIKEASVSDKGITVPGSESKQKFTWSEWFETTGVSEVIVLQLRGKVGSKKAVKAVTVDVKPKCETCGRVNKATSKFCANCGTSLNII